MPNRGTLIAPSPTNDYSKIAVSAIGKEKMTTTAKPVHPVHACMHTPQCPPADQVNRDAAHVVAAHPEQGWSLLCNGVVLFEDTGELLPDGQSIAVRRRDLLACASHRAS
jgi:hypothetical protein